MTKFWRHAVVATVATALLSGVAAQPAQAAPQAQRASVSVSSVATQAAATTAAAVTRAATTTTSATEVVDPQITPAKLIRALGSRLGAALAAIRAGWAAFQAWWNALPTLVRLALRAIGSAWTYYKVLCGYYNYC